MLCLFSSSCIVSSLTFRSLIHFELIFMYGVREHILHKQSLGFLQPLLPLIVKSAKGTSPPNAETQDWDTQRVTPPLSPQGRSLGNPLLVCTQVPACPLLFSSYRILCGSFSQLCLYRSFQVVFSENHSTCRYIHYVFLMWE